MSSKKVPVSDNKPIVKYKVLRSEKYGRYLVAGKKLDTGEVIMRKKPVVIGPSIYTDNNEHSCFECQRIIPTAIGNSNISCGNCQVAIFCCVACKTRNSHHTIEECEILKNKTISFRLTDFLLPLRVWLIKKHDKKLWEKISRMEAHLEARRDTYPWRIYGKKVINTLKSLGVVDKSEENNFPELIHRICGILDVNSFGISVPGGVDDNSLRGLYLEASLIAHSCQGNTYSTFDDELHLIVQASKPIDDGEIILYNYTSPLLGMAERRKRLRQAMYFDCDCPVCEDPQELGTNLSTMFCPYCSNGLITFATGKTKDPYGKEKNWKCNKCQISLSGYLISFYLYLVKMRIKSVENSIKELEILLEKLSSTFHPNHFLMVDIKRKLLELLQIENKCSNQSRKISNRMIEIKTDILNILEIEEPGISTCKGLILYEIFTLMLKTMIIDRAELKTTPKDAVKQMEKLEKYLKKSLEMLQYAPASTIESLLAKKVLKDYQSVCLDKDILRYIK